MHAIMGEREYSIQFSVEVLSHSPSHKEIFLHSLHSRSHKSCSTEMSIYNMPIWTSREFYGEHIIYLELANFESSNQIAEGVDPCFPYCRQYSLPLAYVKSVISLDNHA